MGGGNAFVLLNVCLCHSYAKLGENEKMRYICGWPWGGIFSGGQAQTGAVDRSGSGHQSCNSCEQYWCKLGAQKGSCKQLSAPPCPHCSPLKMCHLTKSTSIMGFILPGVARDCERANECRRECYNQI